MVFHVSEDGGIKTFEPRAAKPGDEPLVWAIDDERLRNYLVPRDCPRVTYYAGPATSDGDRVRFLGPDRAVMAIERSWLDRLRTSRLYCYHLPQETFHCADACAGYFVSRVRVTPARVEVIDDTLTALLDRGVELRIVSSLWPLRDAVVASTLQFSLIRMRNASPRHHA
jgi:hypothetical protein